MGARSWGIGDDRGRELQKIAMLPRNSRSCQIGVEKLNIPNLKKMMVPLTHRPKKEPSLLCKMRDGSNLVRKLAAAPVFDSMAEKFCPYISYLPGEKNQLITMLEAKKLNNAITLEKNK